MRFTVRQRTLLTEIELLRSVASRKSKDKTNTALKGILVQAGESGLTLSATDTEVSITTTCPVEQMTAVTPGSMIVPAAKLCDVVKRFTNVPIDFELLENDRIRLRCGEAEYKIACEKPEKFPDVPRPEIYPASIPLNILLGQIIRTEFAIPNEQSNAPKGLSLVIKDNIMTMFAVDGNQCPLVKSDVNFPIDLSAPIPRSGVDELTKLLNDVKEANSVVSIARDENHIFFKIGNREMTSRLLAVDFPNIYQMFDKFSKDDHPVIALVEHLTGAIQGATVMSDEKQPRVLLDVGDGKMTITSQGDEGDAKEVVKIASNGLRTQITFDSRYLLPSLNLMEVDKVQMDIINPEAPDSNPVLFTPIGEELFDWRVIIMPCRAI